MRIRTRFLNPNALLLSWRKEVLAFERNVFANLTGNLLGEQQVDNVAGVRQASS